MRELGKENGNSTEQPYVKKFGSFSHALHVAGYDSRMQVDSEELEDQLRRAVHEKIRAEIS